jgi:polyisoprenoid-binding protein YceI
MTAEAAPELEHYRLDPAASTLTVQAFAEGLLSAFGHDPVFRVNDFSGEAEFVPGTFENAALKVVINANSLLVTNVKEKDRQDIEGTMRNEVLETRKYPEIVFESHNISLSRIGAGRYRARVVGDLTLHGVTQRNVWVDGEVTASHPGELGVKGQCQIKQTDYRIKLVSVAGGTLKVKNEVRCSFDVRYALAMSDML